MRRLDRCMYCTDDGNGTVDFASIRVPIGDSAIEVTLNLEEDTRTKLGEVLNANVPTASVWLAGNRPLKVGSYSRELIFNYCPVCGRKLDH